MAQRIKGITVEIGGDTVGLQKALKDVNDKSRNLQTELRDVERLLKFDPTNVEALAQKQKLLNEQVENTSLKLDQLRAAEKQVEQQFNLGEISEQQFRAFRREIEFTERSLNNLRGSISEVNNASTKKAASGLKNLKKAAKEVKGEIDELKSGFAALGGAAAAGVGALVVGSQEYNEVLARLRTNAQLAGNDLGIVDEAFQKIVGITGEADAAGETLANLLASGFSDEQLSEVIDQVNGAYIKFSDTLKTEGIADGIQETFATGKATGSFAELLERSGVDLEEFDEKLAETGEGAERSNLILKTLQEQGFGGITEKYEELNPEVKRTAEANASLQKSLAELAIVFAPIVAGITELVTKAIQWMEKNPELTTTIIAIVTAVGAVIAICMALAPVLAIITGLATALNVGMLPITLTMLGIIAIIALLVAAGIYLWKNWDEVKVKAKELAAKIKEKFQEFKENIKEKMAEAWEKIKEIWDKVTTFFKGIDLKQIGKDIIQGLIDGIANMGKALYGKAEDLAKGIVNKFKDVLQLGSPSKVTMEIGEFTGEGFAQGLQSSMSRIKTMSAEMAAAAVPDVNTTRVQTDAIGAEVARQMTVNIHSPKALDIREANKQFNRTLNRMSLIW